MQWPDGRSQGRCRVMAEHLQRLATSRTGSWRIFVKKIQSLSFLATLAVVIGMISWGSALNAQSTPSAPADQQTPQTQPAPSPEMPPAAQQTPSSSTPSSQTPSSTPDQSSPSPSSQTPSQAPSSTPDQSAQPPASSQTPSAQPPASQTPDATAPESGSKTANPSGSAASSGAAASNPDGSQTFSGTVVKQGDKYVLKDDAGKTYDIDHQTDVAKFEGKRVRVQGTLDPSGKIMVK